MEFVDYYKILGLDKSAGTEDIKKAYRKLARKHYDQYGKDWQHAEQFEQARQHQRQQQYAGSGGHEFSGDFGDTDFSDFFTSMFGGGSRSQRRQKGFKGHDYEAELHLRLKEAATTHQQTLTVNGKNIRITIHAGVENDQKIKLKGH